MSKTDIDIRDFPCSYCGAKRKKPCTTRSGDESAVEHQPRMRAFRAAGGRNPHRPLADGRERTPEGGVPQPIPNAWKGAFLRSTLRTGFCLALSQPMLEFLCAVACGVQWDREVFRYSMGQAAPSCTIATGDALIRKGLIQHRGSDVLRAEYDALSEEERHKRWRGESWTTYKLTPAGKAVVEMLRLAGIFIQPAAVSMKSVG